MRRWLTQDDIIETYTKIKHRGVRFLKSKLTLDSQRRTLSAFDDADLVAPHWWIIPAVRRRWRSLITGDPDVRYEDYMIDQLSPDKSSLSILSIGSGVCSHELYIAKRPEVDRILCVDIASSLLAKAKQNADEQGLTNIDFLHTDIYTYDFQEETFDVVYFHASLHHFADIDGFITQIVLPRLRPGGYVVINEYVGPDRLQFSAELLKEANEALRIVPSPQRKRYKSALVKKRVTGSGLLRMIVADPSECVDASSILPVLRSRLTTIVEKPYGGNILVPVLKDISHHFVPETEVLKTTLNKLFEIEDHYIANHDSHYIFGIYQVQ